MNVLRGLASGLETIAAVARGTTTVTAVAEAGLERVRAVDETVQAFRAVDEAAVLSRAKELDDGPSQLLAGLTVGVKDVIDTADLPTGYGSALFTDHQPLADADVVAALRAAGALIVGKTESTEFAMYQPTRTRNPHDPTRTPGGSSSGSAAAVAAGMVHVALGTQTAGSVLRPASYCGVYGFKPSRGWASTRGIWQLAESLDTVGLFARSVSDLHLVYDVLRATPAGSKQRSAPRAQPGALVLDTRVWGECEPAVTDAIERACAALTAAGWAVSTMAMPPAWAPLVEHHKTVMAAEVAHNLRRRLGTRVDSISPSAQAIVEAGDRTPAPDYVAALAARDEALATAQRLALTTDLLVTPSALGVAPKGLDFTGDPVMCRPWTLLGLPAASVPAHGHDGLPVGVQFAGLSGDDDFLLHLAAVEAALKGLESRV